MKNTINYNWRLFKPNQEKTEKDWDMIYKRMEFDEADNRLENEFELMREFIHGRIDEIFEQ